MPMESILLLGLLLLLPLMEQVVNLVRGRKRGAPRPPPPAVRVPEVRPASARPPRATERPVPRLASEVLAARRSPTVAVPAPRERRPRRRARELRRAVAWMAVLGPCRAHEPYRRDD